MKVKYFQIFHHFVHLGWIEHIKENTAISINATHSKYNIIAMSLHVNNISTQG